MARIFGTFSQVDCRFVFPSDEISYLLAKIINFAFEVHSEQQTLRERRLLWQSLRADLDRWKANFPQTFAPFSHAIKAGNPFPSIWLLQPFDSRVQFQQTPKG